MSPRLQSTFIYLVAVADVNMKRPWSRFTLPRQSGATPANHHHRIAQPHFGVESSRAAYSAKGFFSAKRCFHKANERVCILRHNIRRQRAIAFWNRRHARSFRRLLLRHRRAEAVVHLFNRHFLDDGPHTPGVTKRIEQGAVSIAIELVGWRHHHFGSSSHSVLYEAIHIGHLNGHKDRRISQRLRAITIAARPLFGEEDD